MMRFLCLLPRRPVRRATLALMSLFSCYCAQAYAVGFDWDNARIGDNNLGRLARACSSRHCQAGVDGLDLWLSLKEVCVLADPRALPREMLLVSNVHKPRVAAGWPVTASVVVLAAVAGVGLFAGFRVGSQMKGRARPRKELHSPTMPRLLAAGGVLIERVDRQSAIPPCYI